MPFLYFLTSAEKGPYMAKESLFQANLIKKIKSLFPESIVLKNDPNYKQGVPDILVLYNKNWAALECKRSENSKHQPNQDYYVSKMNEMSYSAFVYPENEKEILDELQQALGA